MSEKTILKLHKNGDFEPLVPVYLDKNLYVRADSSPGYINVSGVFTAPSRYERASAYIPVEVGERYSYQLWLSEATPDFPYPNSNNNAAWSRVAFFDKDFKYLSNLAITTDSTGITPLVLKHAATFIVAEGAKYVRISGRWFESPKTLIQFEKGDYTDYAPALKDIFGLDDVRTRFTKDMIVTRTIIELPSLENRNYFIERETVKGWADNYENRGIPAGEVNPPQSNYDRVSGFISVDGWQKVNFRIINENYSLARVYYKFLFYDANRKFNGRVVYDSGGAKLEEVGSTRTFTQSVDIRATDKYMRLSIEQYDNPRIVIKVTVTKDGPVPEHHHLAIEDLPTWVRDTGNPISLFEEGIAIKGSVRILNADLVFKDDFNRMDMDFLGGTWEVVEGGFGIRNAEAKALNTNATNNTALIDVGNHGNISISALVTHVSSEGIIFRGIDASNYMNVTIEASTLNIRYKQNGTSTHLKAANITTRSGMQHKLRIELRGREIKVFHNDVHVLTEVSSIFENATKHGLKSWANSAANGSFENFEIRRLS